VRVTNTMMVHQAIQDLDKLRREYYKAQNMVNGRVLERPSEDPQRVAEAMDLSGIKLRLQRSQRSGQDAMEWLRTVEISLSNIIDRLQAARELAVQTGGATFIDPEAREATARALEGVRDSLLRELNSQHRGQYLFAGTRTDTQPFTMDPVTGQLVAAPNIGGKITRDIAPGLSVVVNVPGTDITAQGDFIKTINDMIKELRAGVTQPSYTTHLAEIDAALNHLTTIRSELGVRQNQVEQYDAFTQDALLHMEERLTNLTGGDLETAVLRMTEAQNAYQTALASFAKTLPNSLLDYMLR
jgi:flagellar hook-associated protein 3 FlgL